MEEMDRKYRHRLRLLMIVTGLLWAAFIGRFYYLQIVSHEELATAAVSQYQVVVEGLDTRGKILDRNLQPLTGETEQYYYFIPNDRADTDLKHLLTAVSARQISLPESPNRRYTAYRTQLFDETVNEKLKTAYGAYVFCSASRYSDTQTACHLIGYLNEAEQKGVSGLEQLYEDILKSDESRLTLWADGKGRLLLNMAPRKEGGSSPLEENLVTTIDRGIQNLCENAVSRENLKGAVLVSDVQSGDVLGWVSSPGFNPNEVEAYLHSTGGNLVNKCIQGTYAPGSVFKIAVAAAALESGLPGLEDVYVCSGQTEVEGITLGCLAGPEGGHGEVGLDEAMAVSCNCYFAHLGARLGAETVVSMARQLGFGQTVFKSFSEEVAGNLPLEAETGPWDISNLSIGQGALLVTPAQVHQMMAVVANGGVLQPLTVVSGTSAGELSNGSGGNGAKRVLSEYTAARLCAMLEGVMTEGTGSGGRWPCPVYGKTGTAETVRSGVQLKDCWFSGFCKVNGRTYAVTVLAEEGVSGTKTCLPVFQEICSYLTTRNFVM